MIAWHTISDNIAEVGAFLGLVGGRPLHPPDARSRDERSGDDGPEPDIGREYAHDLVYDICREAVKQQRPLLDLLAVHPEINKHLDRAVLAELCDPANYLGQSGVMVDRVLATLR